MRNIETFSKKNNYMYSILPWTTYMMYVCKAGNVVFVCL